VAAAAATGSEVELLRAMKTHLAETISSGRVQPRELSPLMRRLLETSRELSQAEAREADDKPMRRPGGRASGDEQPWDARGL
jgi:hypothetical protein